MSAFLPAYKAGHSADLPVKVTGFRLFTFCHTNRSFEDFLALQKKEFEIGATADIRRLIRPFQVTSVLRSQKLFRIQMPQE
jgi:hypothetical protein